MSYIYLVQTRESIKLNESIYKIGKTKRNGLERFTSYPKGSDLLFHIACPDCDILEKHLIDEFKNKFIQITDYGTEYFKGDPDKMIDNIFSLVKKQKDACKKLHEHDNQENSIIQTVFQDLSNEQINNVIKSTIANNPKKLLTKIIKNKNGNFKCQFCAKNYKSRTGLWKHNKTCIELSSENVDKHYICNFCDKVYNNKYSKYKHQKNCKKLNNDKDNVISVIKSKYDDELKKLKNDVETIKNKKKLDIDV